MAKKLSRLQRYREEVRMFLDESRLRAPDEPVSRLYKFVHFWILVAKSFVQNRCPIRASALAYATLIALIPMLALAMSVTTSVLKDEGAEQIEQFIQKFVDNIMPPAVVSTTNASPALEPDSALTATNAEIQSFESETNIANANLPINSETNGVTVSRDASVIQAQKEAAQYIKDFIQNTSSTTLGVTGTIVLVFVAIAMLSRIEETFNDIWGVTQGRNWFMRIVLYWTTITLGPLLLAGALAVASGPHLTSTKRLLTDPALNLIFKVLPLFVLCGAFTLFYKVMPNAKVHFKSALVGGIVGGTLWYLNNLVGFLYVSRVVTNFKIYGSLGLVLVFMFGLYLSWLIVLFGAQVAYAFQNRALYLQEKLAENVNQRGREFIALRLMTCIGQRFTRGMPPPTIQEMSVELGIPSRLSQQVLQTLIAAHLVMEVSGPDPAYTPARPLESITAHHVLQAMRATQGQELLTRDEPVREEVYGEFARIQEAEKQVASGVTILALANRAQARLEFTPQPAPDDEIKLKHALVPPAKPATKPEKKPGTST